MGIEKQPEPPPPPGDRAGTDIIGSLRMLARDLQKEQPKVVRRAYTSCATPSR
jgi:hypothetical protein